MNAKKQQEDPMSVQLDDDFLTMSGHRNKSILNVQLLVKQHLVEMLFEKAKKEASKHVNLPGYRKGKAPVDKVISIMKKEIHKDLIHKIYDYALSEIVRLYKAYPSKKIKNVPGLFMAQDAPFSVLSDDGSVLCKDHKLSFELEVCPTETSLDIKLLSSWVKLNKEPDISLTDLELEIGIMDVALHFAKESDVSQDNIIDKNHKVNFTILAPEFDNTEYSLLLIPHIVSTGVFEAFCGHKVNDVISIPAVHSVYGLSFVEKSKLQKINSAVSFKDVLIEVKINKVIYLDIPEINENWVLSLGASSIEDFKQKISTQLVNKKKLFWLFDNRQKITQAIVENMKDIFIPESWIQDKVASLATNEDAYVDTKKITDDFILQVVLYNSSIKNKIEVNDNDYDGYIQRSLVSGELSLEKSNQLISKPDWKEKMHDSILIDKTLDFLVHEILALQNT